MNRGTLCNRVVTRLKPDILTLKVLTQCHRSLTRRLSRVDQSSRRTILRLLLAIAWSSDRTTAIRITVDLLEMNKPWMVRLDIWFDEAAGLQLSIEHHNRVDIDSSPYREACFRLELKLMVGAHVGGSAASPALLHWTIPLSRHCYQC